MNASLVDRWIRAVEPMDVNAIKGRVGQSYSKAVGLDEETTQKLKQALDGFDQEEMRRILHTFAEEHFSEEALEAAVTFFESELGKRYLKERKGVMKASEDRINQHIAVSVKKAFGL